MHQRKEDNRSNNEAVFCAIGVREEELCSGGAQAGLIGGTAFLAGQAASQGSPSGFSPGGGSLRGALAAGTTLALLGAAFATPIGVATTAALGLSSAALADG